ncbi:MULTISPECIES: sulfurtransferase complex subunit TusC [Glaesserella]|uniref:Sulfurtransferase complex subunit TusC n=1 Tax=Glaesserella australis TaxID=2094024 RepID=A0A328BZS0_9PAST|nr:MULTISPECIES: sulfurtransferase complex subunit TusC [Glaesserella]AUI66744.1 sulfurtransferase complex subunit TusC [Glaesserella sp. 15-184]RAL19796.1 sulfurtransferase complex subunit TusC [Glaesserella australis]
MKYKVAILFTQAPFGTATSREGLDALLAASAFCNEDEMAIAFLNDGVFNLVANQQPDTILQKDHISTFKLLDLYDLSECFVCQQSIDERNLNNSQWILSDLNFVSRNEIFDTLRQAEKVLTF